MDNFFKAAVSNLDKLLDEFEQDTDETKDNRTVNPHDSKHHVLSSELDYQQLRFLEPNVQENSSSFPAASEELTVSIQTTNVANSEQPNSGQNEKNVTGLDLLSMVDGGSSDKNQSACLGRSIPVCDLISDTGNLSNVISNSENTQKLQADDFQCNTNSLIGLDLALVPATACSLSVDCSTNSCTEQQFERDAELYDRGYNAAEKQIELPGSNAETNVVDFGGGQDGAGTMNNSQLFDHPEQSMGLHRTSALLTQPVSNVHHPNVETICEKLSCVPLVDKNTHCIRSQVICGESGKQPILTEDEIPSVASNLPKVCQLNNRVQLPEVGSFSESSLQSAPITVSNQLHITEDKHSNSEQNPDNLLNIVPTPEASEDVQTSLSCLPLAVSMCGSLVTTEDKNGKVLPNQTADVTNDKTVHIGKCQRGLPQGSLHGQEESLNKASQHCSVTTPFMEGEELNFDIVTNKYELIQQKETVAAFGLDATIEPCCNILPTGLVDRIPDDFSIEEDLIRTDVLISDAELDAFLSEQSGNSESLKEATDVLLHSDINQDKLTETSNVKDTETAFKKVETSVNDSSIPESKIGNLVEKSTLQLQQETSDQITETGGEVSGHINNQQIVHSRGARPKQLQNLPSKGTICSELGSPNTPGGETQVTNSTVLDTSLSDAIISSESNRYNSIDTQSCLEDKEGSVASVVSEPSKVVEQVVALGQKQPSWVPDSEAPNCMNCQAKFTFTKRRHHCRACGKVFCGSCCNRKCKLQYLTKEARVCVSCYESINKAQAFERMMSPTTAVPVSDISEHCSTVPPLQEVQASGTPNSPSVSVSTSVHQKPDDDRLCSKDQRRVWFADGILPNGEVADTTKLSSGVRRSPPDAYLVESSTEDTQDGMHVVGSTEKSHYPTSVLPGDKVAAKEQIDLPCNLDCLISAANEFPAAVDSPELPDSITVNENNDVLASSSDFKILCGIESCVSKEINLIPEGDGLPPLLLARGEKGEKSIVEKHPSHNQVALLLEDINPLTFILNANLLVNIKLLSYCSERCWCFSSNGLHGLGQAEIIIVLQCLPEEEDIPKEIFKLFINTYKDAMKGKFIGNLENITFAEGFLGSKEHGGFLFVTPTFQKLDDLILPKPPFLCGILIHKQEVPWAKVFPIRLMLRLGAEYGAYPTPLTSVRLRKPLFGAIGHTVMNLLVDLRNYQYTLHTINNLFIHMEMGRSCIKIPLKSYNEVMKVINTSNEHVISIGASFSSEADSHLVCVQNDDGVYQTQANSSTGHPRKVTGASFVVFNGALKTSSGFLAKSSIVEDGLMVQITPETMDGLRQALREKKDFKITCGKVDSGDLREYVEICWVENEEKNNASVVSPIDGKSMEGCQTEKMIQEGIFEKDDKLVKCTEVFYLSKPSEQYDLPPYQFAKEIASACCGALCQHLKTLKTNEMNKIGLRVSMDTDMVEYQAGSEGRLLPQHYLNDLDSALIPVIHGGTSNASNLPLEIELIFFITESLSI